MKLVRFQRDRQPARPGVMFDDGVVDLGDVAASIETIIQRFDELHPRLQHLALQRAPIALSELQIRAPLPRPGKILCSTNAYGQANGQSTPLLMTLKSAESVIGPGQTVQLPRVDTSWQFVPEAELGLVIRGPAKDIKASDWRSAVFGYTCVIDVMARGDTTFGRDLWLAKSDTLGPLGPCIVTADDIDDPNALRIRSWQNGLLSQDFSSADATYSVGQQVEFATTVMTLHTGDVIACGTSPNGLQPLGDGDRVEVEIEAIGRLAVGVAA